MRVRSPHVAVSGILQLCFSVLETLWLAGGSSQCLEGLAKSIVYKDAAIELWSSREETGAKRDVVQPDE